MVIRCCFAVAIICSMYGLTPGYMSLGSTVSCLLEPASYYPYLTLAKRCAMHFFPFDRDVLSMEMPRVFHDFHVQVTQISRAGNGSLLP